MSSKQKIKLSVLEGIVREIVKTLAKEMSGTAAASPVNGPNAFVKKKVYEDTSANDVMETFHVKTWENLKSTLSLYGLDIRTGYVKAQEKTETVLGAAGFTFDPATKTYSSGDKSQTVMAFPQRVYVWKYKNFGKILKNTNHLAEWLASKSKDFISQVGNSEYVEPAPSPSPSVKRESKEDAPVNEMTTTGAVSGFNVPGCFSRKGGSQKGVEGSAALGYNLTPIGKKEMQRDADKIHEGKNGTPICNKCHKPLRYTGQIECQKCGKIQENQQGALGRKFSNAQRSYDSMSEPDEKPERTCKLAGHDWVVRAYTDPKSGKLTTWRQCEYCGVITNPTSE